MNCSVCDKEVPKEASRCSQCARIYCKSCLPRTMSALGCCPDCEETHVAEEDYFGWE